MILISPRFAVYNARADNIIRRGWQWQASLSIMHDAHKPRAIVDPPRSERMGSICIRAWQPKFAHTLTFVRNLISRDDSASILRRS